MKDRTISLIHGADFPRVISSCQLNFCPEPPETGRSRVLNTLGLEESALMAASPPSTTALNAVPSKPV
jgi:hypothetical protein